MTKKPRRQRTKAGVPGTPGAKPSNGSKPGDNAAKMTLAEEREVFGSIRSHWIVAQSKMKIAKRAIDDVVAEAHASGFTKKALEIADDLATMKGEAKVKDAVELRLRIARLIGHPMGAQFDLFADAKPQPSVDRAFDEGQMASVENRPAKPDYSPETPEYDAYMRGFHEHQGTLAGGIKATDGADVRPRHLRQPGASAAE